THGLEIDNSCKDISRLCFISHDPDIYINETPEILEFKQVDVVESNTSLKLDTPLNVEEITSALESLDAGMGYDGWLSVGMALHDAFDGSDTGSAIFEKWSATSWKYEHGEPDKKWNSFTSTSGGITIRTLFKMAIDSGWACSVGHDLVRRIEGKASKLQGFDIQALNIDPLTIDKIITSSFWDPKKSRYYSLTARNVLNMYSANDGLRFLEISSGSIFSKSYVYEWAEQTGLAEAKTKAIIKSFNDVVTEHLMFESQRTNIEMRVDMFADTPRIEMREELARVVYTHSLFVEGPWSAEVVADYKEHFPLLDEFLDFIIASRFARDRKKAYLWLKADSDWGKGFLMGVLNKLNMSVEISVKEVEKMFEGSPVGKSMVDFKRAFAIVVDEFKTVKSEIKQLQSEISLAPKNQLSFKVEVFAKLFFSAESVNSLVGEHGVEEQFINRFNHFNLKGTLDSRPLYRQVGSAKYIDSVTPYVANYLNKAIEEKRAVGKAKAEHDAEQYLIQFMDANGIGNSYDSLTDGLGEFVRELAVYIKLNLYRDVRIIKEGEHTYLLKPAKWIDEYIKENVSFSGVTTLTRKRAEIMSLLSEDGKGSITHRVNKYDAPVKGIKIDPALTNDEF
ncbi:MAG: PriCT-2 domain-containing protein, partial [Gammaproteobacteria bacterium]